MIVKPNRKGSSSVSDNHIVKKYKSRKLRLLVANDDSFQLLVVCNSLKKLSYIELVDEANNGQQALDMVIENEHKAALTGSRKYDLIFLDLTMPIKDGYEACRDILNYYNNTRKISVEEQKEKDDWLTDLCDMLE